jgi:hypothetical protein
MIERKYTIEIHVVLPNGMVYIMKTSDKKVNDDEFDNVVTTFRTTFAKAENIAYEVRGWYHLDGQRREWKDFTITLWGDTLKNSYLLTFKNVA